MTPLETAKAHFDKIKKTYDKDHKRYIDAEKYLKEVTAKEKKGGKNAK